MCGNGQQELAIGGSWGMSVRRRWRILEALLQEILNLPLSGDCLGVIGKTATRLVSRPNYEAWILPVVDRPVYPPFWYLSRIKLALLQVTMYGNVFELRKFLQVTMYGNVFQLRKFHFSDKTFGEITRLDHVKQNKVNINRIPFTRSKNMFPNLSILICLCGIFFQFMCMAVYLW